MTKPTFITILIVIFAGSVWAQDTTEVLPAPKKQKAPISERIYYGGNVSLAFGSYTRIGVYPLIGYKVTPKFSAGVKLGYEYIEDKRYASTYNTSNYGWSLFSRYRVIQPLYVHVEYAMINYELYDALGESKREWVPFLFAGAGYSQRMGGRAWLNVQVLFDLLQSDKSPYNNWEPFYSIGVGVGF